MITTSRRYRTGLAALLLAGGTFLVLATSTRTSAAPRSEDAFNPRPRPGAATAKPQQPVVMVKKSDGSTVRGQLADADGVRLSIRPAEGKTFGNPVEVKWDDVKTVSNGLTRQKAAQAWKAEHKDKLCDDCKGNRVTRCDTCKGVGHDPAASKDCKTCKGALLVDCTDKRCDKGTIPCPANCIKKSPTVVKMKGWTIDVHGGHDGDVLTIGPQGQPQLKPCTVCGRTAKLTCTTCGGQGDLACPRCKSDKKAADCASCEAGTKPCVTCSGSGLKPQTPDPAAAPQPPAAPAPTPPPTPVATPAPPTPPNKPSTADEDGF